MRADMIETPDNQGTSAPLVSIILSFHNAGETLGQSLQSLLLQTYSRWELILIDDGSSDGSVAVASVFTDPRIRLVRDGKRCGLPGRLNQGVGLSRGLYIARMDADDIAFPERLERQVAFLQAHPEVDLVAAASLMLDNDNRPLGVLGATRDHDSICSRPWHGFPMSHPTWMGRAQWFREHPYDVTAQKAQDQVLLYSCYRRSRFSCMPDVLLGYRYPGLSAAKTVASRYHFLKALLLSGHAGHALRGLATHMPAAIRDLTGIALKMELEIIKSRVRETDPALIAKWSEIVTSLDIPGHGKGGI